VVAAAPANLDPASYNPSVEQVARNLRGSGRNASTVEVRLRRVEPSSAGTDRPVILAAAQRNLADGQVTLLP